MKAIAQRCSWTRRARRISVSPPSTNSSWRRSGLFCVGWYDGAGSASGGMTLPSSERRARSQKGKNMPASTAEKRASFKTLHEQGCFVLPNPWDVGSARALQNIGFKAIASTSAGYAWSIGRPDNHVTLEQVLEHLTALCDAV